MVEVTDFVDSEEALRLGGNPKVATTKPPAELLQSDFDDIKVNSNSTFFLDTGISSIDSNDKLLGSIKNAVNHYAGYLIRQQWQDIGGKAAGYLTEYNRIVEKINASGLAPGQIDVSSNYNSSYNTEYQSFPLNPEAEPYFSTSE
jgi:hypothetical protein